MKCDSTNVLEPSGDMLQQFLITIFDKLDRGSSWDDDFELNNLLQESIRNSADKMLLTAPDSLVVSLATNISDEGASTSKKGRAPGFGINALDMLNFTYKVSWPLDLIVNTDALKKYNQVMGFLLKVKRAKFVLDETRKWMWKVLIHMIIVFFCYYLIVSFFVNSLSMELKKLWIVMLLGLENDNLIANKIYPFLLAGQRQDCT